LIFESQSYNSVFGEYDESAVEKIKSKYVDIINNSSEHFEFIAKVISNFSTLRIVLAACESITKAEL
jgi:hypothetical protein